jgi:ATP-dependent RNA helicase RhlE
MTFNNLDIIAPILQALNGKGYKTPTSIQQQAIPEILLRKDVLGIAQTGTGKTAAFAVPILQLLDGCQKVDNKIRALVLTPTRELATQIAENFTSYGQKLRLRHTTVFGGVPQGRQVAALKAGVDILIATPGRLADLMQQGYIDLSRIEIFVLDEADRMLDMGFVHEVKKIVSVLPVNRQTLFFSATMPANIAALAKTILKRPVTVRTTPVSSTAERVSQSVYHVHKNSKVNLLLHLLKDAGTERSLIFTRTKHGADKLVKQLAGTGVHAAAIHGNKSQNARQKALNDFRLERVKVLVATDIAARGIDIDHLPRVVNYDMPEVAETYVHRIGRTGRGTEATGKAISFCDHEEAGYLKNIQKLIGFPVPVLKVPAHLQ